MRARDLARIGFFSGKGGADIFKSETVVGDLVPLTTYKPVFIEAFGCTTYPVTPFKLEEGKTYTVIFDGVEYSCIAKTFSMGTMNGISVGNTIFAGGANTGEPFAVGEINAPFIYSQGGGYEEVVKNELYYMVLGMDAEQHTLRVIGEKTVYNKIPVEYVKSDFFVEFATNLDGSMVMVTPWEEIADAVKTNANIYGVFAEENFEIGEGASVSWKNYCSSRWILLHAKIGRDGYEQQCKLIFYGFNDKTGVTLNGTGIIAITCDRDANGVTTIREGIHYN